LDAVGYIHSSDDNAPNLLVTDKVDAAATSHREFENLRPEIQSDIKVIARSMSVPRQIISVRKDLDPKIVAALNELLTGMDKTGEGQAVLKRQQHRPDSLRIPRAYASCRKVYFLLPRETG
jgi:ABC-type phosphate/phosphonate transport system substrate-binding protein